MKYALTAPVSVTLKKSLRYSTALTLSVTASMFLGANPALAVDNMELPSGGTVVGGSASLNYTAPGQLNIDQSSDRTVINWDSFNIGEKAGTTFHQPSATALAVNRVVGAGKDPAQILGSLRANGRVVVLDRNGVVFGKNSRVDTAGIIASTGDVDTAQVMSGTDRIELKDMGTGTVENQGQITVADGGLAALVAPSVRNSGTISARLGRVALASGEKVTVDLYGDKLVELAVDEQTSKAIIEQTGTINAEGGSIEITAAAAKDMVDSVINLDGITNASSVSGDAGRIVLSADTINLAAGAEVKANATTGHRAGSVRAIARNRLDVAGTVQALGAEKTGDIETSAASVQLAETTKVNTTGTWLLDPTNITIDAVAEGVYEAALTTGDLVIQTPAAGADVGNIYVNRTIDWSTGHSLTMTAANDILFGVAASGLNATGAGNITLNAGRNIRISNGTGLSSMGGNVTLNSRRFRLSAGTVNAHGGNIDINNTGGFQSLANSILTSGTGTISLNQNKDSDPVLTVNTIQNAINAISNAGTGANTLTVGAGTFFESLTIDRQLTLNGANAGVDVLGARGPETVVSSGSTLINVTADDVTIDGLTIKNGYIGVKADTVSDTTVANTIIHGVSGFGVYLNAADHARITGNRLYGVGAYAVFLNALSDFATVSGNIISDTGNTAISSDKSASGTFTGNYIGYTDRGITAAAAGNIKGDGIQVVNAGAGTTLISANTITNTLSPYGNRGNGIQVGYTDNVQILNNTIRNTGWDGIRLFGGSTYLVHGNAVNGVARSGTYFTDLIGVTITGNTFQNALTSNGINGDKSSNATLSDNTVDHVAKIGINLLNLTGTTTVDNNAIDYTGSSGIEVLGTPKLALTNNAIGQNGGNIGADGILVINSYNTGTDRSVISNNRISNTASPASSYGSGIQLRYSTAVDVRDNTTSSTAWDGIRFYGGTDYTATNNSITTPTRTGIYFTGIKGVTISRNTVTNALTSYGLNGDNSSDSNLLNNTVNTVARSGINMTNLRGNTVVSGNSVTNAALDGIAAADVVNLDVGNNTVNAVAGSGVYIHGPFYGNNAIHGNSITNADIGMTFESGLVDLSGDANTLNATRIGYRFAPVVVKGGFSQVDLAGNTIGTTNFNGQTSFYVQLLNGALFAPDLPTVEDGLNAVYDGVNPSSSGGFVTAAQLATLEAKFWHFNDDNTVGLFLFGTTPPLDVSRVFRQSIAGFLPGPGVAGFTITGLPRIPGATPPAALPDVTNPAALNALAPAAGPGAEATDGGTNDQTAAQLAAIAPAAGAADASCWSDASSIVDGGRSVNYNFGSDPSSILSDTASCGQATP